MAIIEVNGRNIHYELHKTSRKKEAMTLVLIHANAVDLRAFDTMLNHLGESHHILRYDLRGYGKSDNDLPIEDLTISQFALDLHELLSTLEMKEVHLIGWQMGALIGARYAALHPNAIRSLTLMSMPCHPPHMIEQIREHRRNLAAGREQIPFAYLEEAATTLPKRHVELLKLSTYADSIPFNLYEKVMDLTISADPISDIRELFCPTLILTGAKEILFPSHYLQLKTLHLRHCRFMVVPNASSLIVLDQPKMVAQIIVDFIDESREQKNIEDSFIQSMDERILDYVVQIQEEGTKKFHMKRELRVDLLQQFRVFLDGEEVLSGWNKRFSKSLLIYLLFHRSTTREQICETLWPEIPLQQAKSNFRVYLSHLRQQLTTSSGEHCFLVIDREHVSINGNLVSDAFPFLEQIEEANKELSPDLKELKINQIIDGLPPQLFAAHHDEWFHQLRIRLEESIIDLVLWNVNQHIGRGEYSIAFRQLNKTVSVIPTIELYELLIKLYEKVGNYEKAKQWQQRMFDFME